jgi:uncharacterized repeat protein (TIGR02059 family)
VKNALLLIMLLLSSSVAGTTYYIDLSGKDANNGSSTSPWKSLAYACSKVSTAGDIIHVNAGTYTETAQSVLAVGVSIEGVGVTSVIQSSVGGSSFTISLYSSKEGTIGNQHITNIKMDGNALTAYGAIKIDRLSNVEIYNCTFIDFNYYGVGFDGDGTGNQPSVYPTGNKFHDNIVTNCSGYFPAGDRVNGEGKYEVGVNGQDGMLIYNNTLDQTSRPAGSNGYCIKGVAGYNKNIKIYNNSMNKAPFDNLTWDFAIELWNNMGGIEIYDNTITGSIDFSGPYGLAKGSTSYSVWVHNNLIGPIALSIYERTAGIILEQGTEGVIIEKNHIKNVCSGIIFNVYAEDGYPHYVKNISISYNILQNIGIADGGPSFWGWGIWYETTTGFIGDDINIWNNTIIAHVGSLMTVSGIELPIIGTSTNVSIRNNIIQGFNHEPICAGGGSGQTLSTLSLENNIFYNNGNNNLPRYSGITPSNNTTQNNIISNPLFISPSDFHLQAGSPAIGKGLKITDVTTDYDGNTLKDPPSIGAYEFYSTGLPVYQNSAIANVSPSLLELSYNLSLANIVPAVSSFNVLVNSVVRTVNSVVISGNKVQLTLASPVVNGDVVTVSYTIPAINPLQNVSGVPVASLSSKPVTNNCISTIPVYSASVVENATPSLIDMTYNLSLANNIPANSAFNVQVNSATRNVKSVTISGNKVSLALESVIKFGDIVTVSYTKPVSNPLQSSTGGQAASLGTKSVTNNCEDPSKANDPPVVIINYPQTAYAGFINVIDASSTYDPNNDSLIAEWTVPTDVPVSTVKSLKTEFLAPVVDNSEIENFKLEVSDGRTILTNNFPITILPYKPELAAARITEIEASDYQTPDYPDNILDGNTTTKWSSDGDNKWLVLKLAEPFKISHLVMAFLAGQKFESYFDIYASKDNINWEHILTGAASCKFSGARQVFVFPALYTNKEYSYLKYVGHGNSLNSMNTVSEIKIFGTPQDNANKENSKDKNVVIYPNPAQSYFNISIGEPSMKPNSIRILDFSGKVVLEDSYSQIMNTIQLPDSLYSGVYIVELRSGTITVDTQKLIIKK